MRKPTKFTAEYFQDRGFEWEENEWMDYGWVLYHDGSDSAFVFVDCADGRPETCTLYFGIEGDPFPYDFHDTQWLDEILYAIWRVTPKTSQGGK
jgi:hypothetical protein